MIIHQTKLISNDLLRRATRNARGNECSDKRRKNLLGKICKNNLIKNDSGGSINFMKKSSPRVSLSHPAYSVTVTMSELLF